ncbi:MAG: hypothetical protein KF747_15175, partial [Nitrospira sp.]|nr:hypothetical protein [Nitrospira sp.]
MLIRIERSQSSLVERSAGPVSKQPRRPSLARSLWGGLRNLALRRPLLAVFQVNLRCNSSCGYCSLPLNVGRYEMSREEIREVFAKLY